MVADARRDTRRDLGRADPDDAVAERGALARGDRDADEGHEDAIGAQNLAELLFVHVLRIDLFVVDDGTQARTGERHFRLRILALQIVDVQRARKRVLAEIGKSQKRREPDAAHSAAQSTLLRVKAIRPDALMSHQVQFFVCYNVIRFLKNGHIVGAALVQIAILIRVDGINLQPDHAEIFARKLARLADIFDIALDAALAR